MHTLAGKLNNKQMGPCLPVYRRRPRGLQCDSMYLRHLGRSARLACNAYAGASR